MGICSGFFNSLKLEDCVVSCRKWSWDITTSKAQSGSCSMQTQTSLGLLARQQLIIDEVSTAPYWWHVETLCCSCESNYVSGSFCWCERQMYLHAWQACIAHQYQQLVMDLMLRDCLQVCQDKTFVCCYCCWLNAHACQSASDCVKHQMRSSLEDRKAKQTPLRARTDLW